MRILIANKNLLANFNLNTNLNHNKLTIKKEQKSSQLLQKNLINKLKNKNLIKHIKFNNNYMNKNKYIIIKKH